MDGSGELFSVLFILLLAFLAFGVFVPVFEFIMARFPKVRKGIYKLFDLPDDEADSEDSAEEESKAPSRAERFFLH